MKTGPAITTYRLELDFFDDADALWEQLGRALAAGDGDGSGPLSRVGSAGAYNFLLATAGRVFDHGLVLKFLSNIRRWAKEELGAQHASTPQVHVYADGCRRALAPDAVAARWHYLYSLTRSGAAGVRLLEERRPGENRFGITLGRVLDVPVRFNQLLVHESRQAYGIDGPRGPATPVEAPILLHGYFW